MCDVNKGRTNVDLNALKLNLHLTAKLEVQCTQRFVEKQHVRLINERSCHGDALLLTTGELGGLSSSQVR
ncbi:unannotated protein [freshwater metagenome]|uniref:Unannotated protein n=1 Tax=freshwater metagenome TaxID=449393 RepID=A0A6J6I189_9ZZZZ